MIAFIRTSFAAAVIAGCAAFAAPAANATIVTGTFSGDMQSAYLFGPQYPNGSTLQGNFGQFSGTFSYDTDLFGTPVYSDPTGSNYNTPYQTNPALTFNLTFAGNKLSASSTSEFNFGNFSTADSGSLFANAWDGQTDVQFRIQQDAPDNHITLNPASQSTSSDNAYFYIQINSGYYAGVGYTTNNAHVTISSPVVSDPAATNVPEPASLALLSIGLIGLGLKARRKSAV